MRMNEKIKRGRQHAQAALDAYRAAAPGQDPDDVACIGDLMADLMHLAEQKMSETAWDGDVYGLVRVQLDHFNYERDPRHAQEPV